MPERTPLFSDRFHCPVCGRLQFKAEPREGTGFYECQVEKCRATWWSATIREGDSLLFLSIVVAKHQRHQARGRPITELLRALRLMDDVQPPTSVAR